VASYVLNKPAKARAEKMLGRGLKTLKAEQRAKKQIQGPNRSKRTGEGGVGKTWEKADESGRKKRGG